MKTRFHGLWLGVAILLIMVVSPTMVNVAQADTAPGDFHFMGLVNSMPASGLIGDWMINGFVVHVSSATNIDQTHGAAGVGAFVAVIGNLLADRSVNATDIAVINGASSGSQVKFIGLVKKLPSGGLTGDWTVLEPPSNQVTVHVSNQTKIDETKGKVAVGVLVKIEGIRQSDGSINADRVEVVFVMPNIGNGVEIFGKIESLPSGTLIGDWVVNGIKIHVTASTKIDQDRAKAEVGAFVQVKGNVQSDASINATSIEVRAKPIITLPINKYVKFYGKVESLPSGVTGTWTISGVKVNVTAETQISNGPAKVGSIVEVKGLLQTNGSINAVKIEVKGAGNPSSPFGQSSAFANVNP